MESRALNIDEFPGATLVAGPDGSILQANSHAERLFGFEPGSMVGLEFHVLIQEERREEWLHGLESISGDRPGSSVRYHYVPCVTDDGRELTIDIDAGGTADGWVAILIRDVTAEREMVGNAQHFSNLMEQSPMGVVIFTPDGQIVEVNPAWMRAWGIDESEAARVMAEYNYLADKQSEDLGVMPLVEKAFAGDPVVLPPVEYSGFRTMQDLGMDDIQPTTIWIQSHLYSIRDQQGAIENVICINMDITDLKAALAEVAALNDRLQAESHYLQSEIASSRGFEEIIGHSDALKHALAHVESVSHTDATVLLLGETGTGKELLARAIHRRSRRSGRPLIKVDCGTLPAGLVESELFGHEKGSFTGAHDRKIGRFELAHEGTILLDEIGELPLDLQAKLLRAIEEGEIRRVGGKSDIAVDVRVIAATNRDLQAEVREGRFRADLFYRMSVFPITAPPLRERREDIPDLVSFFVNRYASHLGKSFCRVDTRTLEAMLAYDWPGNIRELRNVIERAVILCAGETLVVEPSQFGADEPALAPTSGSLKEDLHGVERARILRALEESGWKIKGDGNAASRLGVAPSTLRSRMRTLGITRPS